MVRLIFLFIFAFSPSWALAQGGSLLLEQSFLKDPRAELSIDQVANASFQTYEGHLTLGFQSGAIWIRLKVDKLAEGHEGAPRPFVLRVGPHYLDRIDVFSGADGQWSVQQRGALHAQNAHDCADDMHCFVVQPSSTKPTTVYLRIQHQGFLSIQTEVLSRDDLPLAVAARVRNITLSLVIAMCLLVLGFAFLLHDRSALMLVYCGFQTSVVLFVASHVGVLAKALPMLTVTQSSDLNYFLYVFRVFMTVSLVWAVLAAHQPGRLYGYGIKGLLVACSVSVLLVFAGQMQLALQLSVLVFAINPFLQLYGARVAADLPAAQRRTLTVGLTVYILVLTLGILLNFNYLPWMPNPGFIRQVVDWRLNGFAIGVVFFWFTMLERSAQNRAKAQEMETLRDHAVLARTRQAQLDDRSALIDMLTHELKNPLGTIRFALASLKRAVTVESDGLKRIERIDASIRRMDDLIEHVAYTNKMERATATGQPEMLMAAPLIQELLGDQAEPQRWDVQVQDGAAFHCDRQLLVVILENLMSNARKYAPRDRKIGIRVTMENMPPVAQAAQGDPVSRRCTCFEINNAVRPDAVPEEAHLFERYYRHPSVQSQPGMGLGLSVVKTVAQKMGAQVSYRHERDRVFFTLKVPF